MARVEARPTIQLACTECKERTYTTRKNKKNDPNRIELIQPIAMDQGLRFAIREGGRTVGAGVVTEIIK